jgi:magnesium transporter
MGPSSQLSTENVPSSPGASHLANEIALLTEQLSILDRDRATMLLASTDPVIAAAALRSLRPDLAASLFSHATVEIQHTLEADLPQNVIGQWRRNLSFPEDSVGRLMEPPVAAYRPDTTVGQAIEDLREVVKREFVTYVYVTDSRNHLLGLVVMRDLLFASHNQSLSEIMLCNPYALQASMPLMDAMKDVLIRHYPVYPVLNEDGELLGLVRGFRLFEAQAIEISAQAGSMVGVEKGERISTHWFTSFKSRHPWLQLNLLTAFIAGAVVNFFQGTIDQLVVLAAFLPVLAGQSGNTGCQALAVTLRGMTLGELEGTPLFRVIGKEALLGLLNGVFVGVSAAAGMYVLASSEQNPNALALSGIVLVAMVGSCLISGISGTLVPLTLRRLGADPATASSIFLTTATDVCSMGLLLGLATLIMM